MDDATTDHATVVTQLLGIAQLNPSVSEFERFVRIYPVLRAQADGLYVPEFGPEELALSFDPAGGVA